MSEPLPTTTEKAASPDPDFSARRLVLLSSLVYFILLLGGLGLMYSKNSELAALIPFFQPPETWPRSLEIACLATGVMLISSFLLESYSRQYRLIKSMMVAFFGHLPVPILLFLAVLSGLAEEVLFRGGIQPYLGLIPTAVLFGLVHLGPVGTLSIWTFWAMGAGFLFGMIYDSQQNLFAVILAHILVNAIGFLTLKRQFLSISKTTAKIRS